MDEFKKVQKRNQARELNQIFYADLTEIEKLGQSFIWVTNRMIEQGEAEMELLKALNDRDTLVKEQIKISTIRHVRAVFDECYRRAMQKESEK